MRPLLLGAGFCVVFGSSLAAQAPTGIPAIDSASVARASWASAVRAMRANDLNAARQAVLRAASAWPTQQTYVWAAAVLAARQSDTTATERALRSYAALGIGRDLGDTVFDRYRSLPWFAQVAALHAENRAPIARSRVAATLADSTFWPEGMDVDARTGTIYVTSVRHGQLRAIRKDGTSAVIWPREGARSEGAALATRIDPRGDRIWLTISAIPAWSGHVAGDSSAALLEIPLARGAVRHWRLPPGNHTLGDVVVAANGDVLFSDSGDPALYRLARGADTLRAYRHPLFRSLQGVAVHPNGREAYVADYSHGILRVRLDDGRVDRVTEPANTITLGVDGLAWADGALVAVQNGVAPPRIVRFDLSADGSRITGSHVIDRRADADEPTIGAVSGGEFFYVGTSQWEKHTANGTPVPGAKLAPVVIFAVPYAH